MKIELHKITVGEIASGYRDSAEEGVYGYFGRLNIRPKYQREFVYDNKKRDAVIDTIRRGFPLNVMYWTENDDGTFEVLDGQQRTISFCSYVAGDFSVPDESGRPKTFGNLTEAEKKQITDYETLVYFCSGTDKEKLDWFRIINIAGEKLTEQELRNATYTGEWLTDAKRKFSKTNCVAYLIARDYVSGSPIRQDFLETALAWKSKGKIEDYMSAHQHDPTANELWCYFSAVIEWAKTTFREYRKEMKGLDWGRLYDDFHDKILDAARLADEVRELMLDDEVTNKKGVYYYVLTRNERYLNLRAFTEKQKREAYERQGGVCPRCCEEGRRKQVYDISEMEADHAVPWSKGGKTSAENCVMLCREHNRIKSDK